MTLKSEKAQLGLHVRIAGEFRLLHCILGSSRFDLQESSLLDDLARRSHEIIHKSLNKLSSSSSSQPFHSSKK